MDLATCTMMLYLLFSLFVLIPYLHSWRLLYMFWFWWQTLRLVLFNVLNVDYGKRSIF
jgi:hypothetical protein